MSIIKVKTGGITADAITSTEIADNAVVTAAINADAVTDAKIADDVVGTEHLTANEVDTAALGADAVTGAQLADNAVNSEHYTDGSIDTAHIADAQITASKLASGVGGKVLQVVSVTKTDTFTTSSSSFTDITGLTANITPASSSNKVYINLSVQGSQDVNANRVSYQLIRDNTAISVGASAASRSQASSGLSSPHGDIIASSSVNFLDSPSTTSQITYKVRIANTAGTGNAFVNRTENDENGSGMPRYASTITLMEIAG